MDLFKIQTQKLLKLLLSDKVLCKWFTAMCSEVKLLTGPVIIEKGRPFYGEFQTLTYL